MQADGEGSGSGLLVRLRGKGFWMHALANATWLVLGGSGKTSTAPFIALVMPSSGLRYPYHFAGSASWGLQFLPLGLIVTLLAAIDVTAQFGSRKSRAIAAASFRKAPLIAFRARRATSQASLATQEKVHPLTAPATS